MMKPKYITNLEQGFIFSELFFSTTWDRVRKIESFLKSKNTPVYTSGTLTDDLEIKQNTAIYQTPHNFYLVFQFTSETSGFMIYFVENQFNELKFYLNQIKNQIIK